MASTTDGTQWWLTAAICAATTLDFDLCLSGIQILAVEEECDKGSAAQPSASAGTE